MNRLESVNTPAAFKALGDPRRVQILRLLMSGQATLSQLGREMGLHPAKVRYHLKQLEQAGFVELESERPIPGFVEKYYQATSQAFIAVNSCYVPDFNGSYWALILAFTAGCAFILIDYCFEKGIHVPALVVAALSDAL